MTPLSPLDIELLHFLCAAHHHRCRVTRIKDQRQASLKRLRYAGLVSFEGFIPSPSAIAGWLARRSITYSSEHQHPLYDDKCRFDPASFPLGGDDKTLESCRVRFGDPKPFKGFPETPVPSDSKAPAQPLAPRAVDEGGGADARNAGAPFPIGDSVDLGVLRGEIRAFLKHTGMAPTRFGTEALRDPRFVHDLQRKETVRAKTAERVRAFIANYRPVSAPKVDIKVNALRDPTQAPPGYQSRPGAIDLTDAVIRTAQAKSSPKRKQILSDAAARNAAGKSSGERKIGVHVRMAQRALAERDAESDRLACPIEQAKTKLRRRYAPVCGAEVSGGPVGKFYVGRKLVTEAELLAMAGRMAA